MRHSTRSGACLHGRHSGSGDSAVTCAQADPFLAPESLQCEAARYAGDTDLRHPLLSPLLGDLRGHPSLLVQVGTDEILLDDSRRLKEHAEEAGVEVTLRIWEGMWHVWQRFVPGVPEAHEALKEIGDFVRSPVAGGASGRGA